MLIGIPKEPATSRKPEEADLRVFVNDLLGARTADTVVFELVREVQSQRRAAAEAGDVNRPVPVGPVLTQLLVGLPHPRLAAHACRAADDVAELIEAGARPADVPLPVVAIGFVEIGNVGLLRGLELVVEGC